MGPLHAKAQHWIARGIFDGLSSFDDLECRINPLPEEKDRGDAFEIFIEGYLATQSIIQRVNHWVVGAIPLELRERYRLPSGGTGIDGIYQDHGGRHIAYQVKYRQASHLTFAEVAPFLGITDQFDDRVIFTNARTLNDKAADRTRWLSRDIFGDLSAESLAQIEAWLKQKPLPSIRRTPQRHQREALDDIARTFQSNDRATCVMACGTGKTLVSLWATESAKPKTVLVLVPSLTLLSQTLKEWTSQNSWGAKFSYLCVCSDASVQNKDDIQVDTSEVGFPVATDPAVVRRFLKRKTDDVKVIFSTYHSSPIVGEATKELDPIDWAIFDEAHKTTGTQGSAFAFALRDENIRIRKRLLLTATPRHYDIRHRDKDGDFRIVSMDDETIYGPRAHTLSFAKAANDGIICRYKLLTSVIDKQQVDDLTRTKGITLVQGNQIGASWIANLVATHQAVEKVNAAKIITFHSRIKQAQEFAANEPRGIAYHLTDYEVRHVNGTQRTAGRREVIERFAKAPKAMLTNARCLTEGIDVPAVDMVAFIDPRQSRVDIAQAIGRAMRKPRQPSTKTVGYVLVPLFVDTNDGNLKAAVKSGSFDAVADVLNALQENDEELVDIIREIQQRRGEGSPCNPERISEKVEFLGPRIEFETLSEAVGDAICDRVRVSWDHWYGLLVKYKEREGNCLVEQNHEEDGYPLGVWVSHQRTAYKTGKLSDDRKQRLDELGVCLGRHKTLTRAARNAKTSTICPIGTNDA